MSEVRGLNHWVKEAGRIATEHGFDEQPPVDAICLMHSELSEALEELRNKRGVNEIYFEEPVSTLDVIKNTLWSMRVTAPKERSDGGPPQMLAMDDERTADRAAGHLAAALAAHGLSKLTRNVANFVKERAANWMSGGNPNVEYNKPAGVPIELADCVIRIMHFCDKHNIDLEKAVEMKMTYNDRREFRHGRAF